MADTSPLPDLASRPAQEWRRDLTAVVLLSLALSLPGLRWGISDADIPAGDRSWRRHMPTEFASFNPDEPFVLDGGIDFALHPPSDRDAKYLGWGGSGILSVSAAIVRSFLLAGWGEEEIRRHGAFLHLLAGRFFCAVCGAATAALLYACGRLLRDRTAGWIAALLFAASPVAIELSGQFRPDMPAVAGMTLCLAALAALTRSDTPRRWLLAGLGAGLAAGFKLPALAVLAAAAPPALAALRTGRPGMARLLLLAAGTAAGYALCSHDLLLGGPGAWRVWSVVRDLRAGAIPDSAGRFSPLLFYATATLACSIGPVAAALGYAGLVRGALKREAGALSLLCAGAACLATLHGMPWILARYLLPLSPILCLAAALLLARPGRIRRGLAALALLSTLVCGAERIRLRLGEETRTTAARCVAELAPPDLRIGALTLGSVHFLPWPDRDRHKIAFLEFGLRERWKLRSLENAEVGLWILHEVDWRDAERLVADHPHPEDAAFIRALRRGRTADGTAWRKVGSYDRRRGPSLRFLPRSWEPHDFLYVSPGIEIYAPEGRGDRDMRERRPPGE